MANHDDWRQRVGGVVQLLASIMYADWTLAFSELTKKEGLSTFCLLSPNTCDKKMIFTYFYLINSRLLPAHVSPAYII
jgi:hypothetical protein